ncbi:MAG: trimeric intracellular cation channel family protein [Betaproteobacteria bacterium]
MNEHTLITTLDLAGTFAFAISGAVAARQRAFDLFGIAAIAYAVACGGGIVRDVCIGAIPPAGLSNWHYLAVALVATIMTIGAYPMVQRLEHPVVLFDAIGLGLFAATGSDKTLVFGHNPETAILLGMTTAVGGGVLRDVLLNRVPIIFEREIYASAALVGATIVVVGRHFAGNADWVLWLAVVVCVGLRLLSLQYHWRLPRFMAQQKDKTTVE